MTPVSARRSAVLAFAAASSRRVLPWVAFSLRSGAHFTFQLHHNIAYEVFAHARGITWDDYQRTLQPQFPTPWSVLARDPGAVLARVGFNVFDHMRLDALRVAGLPLAIAAIAGLWLGRAGGALARLAGVWLVAGLLFLALVPAFHSERYSLAVLPAWAALGALGARLAAAGARPPGGHTANVLKPVLALALIVPALVLSAATQRPRTLAAAARGARGRARRPAASGGSGPRLRAQAALRVGRATWPPWRSRSPSRLPQLADAARRDRVRWLYFSWPEAEMRPQFMWLLDTTSAAPGLTVRAVSHGNPSGALRDRAGLWRPAGLVGRCAGPGGPQRPGDAADQYSRLALTRPGGGRCAGARALGRGAAVARAGAAALGRRSRRRDDARGQRCAHGQARGGSDAVRRRAAAESRGPAPAAGTGAGWR